MGIAVLNAMPSPRRAIRRAPTHGFTLLEIMVVIALISLLTTGVAVGAIRMLRDAEDKQAKINARYVSTTLRHSGFEFSEV
jgi:prepilin-type N-terminal cleavage/methylation domain-containing protein